MQHEIDTVVKPTILVVDDTPDNLTLMMTLLKDSYTVKLANNGERALKLAAMPPHPDLILLDIMMPGLDGYDVCQRLKANPPTRDIPVVFLTARSAVDDEKRTSSDRIMVRLVVNERKNKTCRKKPSVRSRKNETR